jgi:glycerol-3-phosphate cytidylyltransferase-like family protein
MAKDGRATKDEYLNTIGKIFTDKYMTALEQLSNDKADKKPIDELQTKLNAVLDGLKYSGKRINMEGDNVMMSGFKMLTSAVEVELKNANGVPEKYKAQSTLNIAIIKGSLTLQLKTKVNGKEVTFSFPLVKDLSVFTKVAGGSGRNAAVANIIVDLIKTNLFNTSDNIKAKWATYTNPTMTAMSVMELIDPFLKKILQTKTVEQLSVKEVVEAHNYHIPFDNTSGFNEDKGFTPEWFIGKLTVNLDKTKPLFTSKRLKVIAATTQDENEVKANKAVYDSTSKRKDSEETTEEVVEEDVVVEEEGVNKVTKAAKNIAEIIAMGNDRNDAQKDKFNNYNTAVAMAKNFVKRGTKERVVLESGEAESIVPLLISMANNFKKLNELNDGSIEDLNFKRTRSQKKLTNKEITSEFSELADNLLIC